MSSDDEIVVAASPAQRDTPMALSLSPNKVEDILAMAESLKPAPTIDAASNMKLSKKPPTVLQQPAKKINLKVRDPKVRDPNRPAPPFASLKSPTEMQTDLGRMGFSARDAAEISMKVETRRPDGMPPKESGADLAESSRGMRAARAIEKGRAVNSAGKVAKGYESLVVGKDP
ncbi:hypothetical protein LTR53_011248, partial [Teratosphaeriaceae sp. CCFEE 6253]